MPAILIQMVWLLAVVALLGFAVMAIRKFVPMDPTIARVFDAIVWVACAVAIIVLLFWLLSWLLGMAGGSPSPSAFPFPPSHPR